MIGAGLHPILHIGPEPQGTTVFPRFFGELDCEKWRILDLDADLLDRCHQDVAILVLAQNGREELHQRRPPDRRAVVEPSAVAGDAHG